MKRKQLGRGSFAAVLATLALLIGGCAGNVVHMQAVAPETVSAAPPPGKARIVFMRPSGVGFAVQSSVFEVKDNFPSLIGILAAKTRIAYDLDPGQHLFMAIGESAEFMSADVAAGKTYYAQISPRMGLWKARFALEPVPPAELDIPSFKSDVDDCKWVSKTDDSEGWATANMQSIVSKQREYYPDWQKLPDAKKPHLAADMGR
ncbi:MAG TPA: hypothetical protein VEG36_11630 [Burkholderiales bacterium]|nr:hypothetical protein [Burkholderiales bacterium]